MLHIKKNLLIAALMTIVTTIVLGLVYPLVVTGLGSTIEEARATWRSRCARLRKGPGSRR